MKRKRSSHLIETYLFSFNSSRFFFVVLFLFKLKQCKNQKKKNVEFGQKRDKKSKIEQLNVHRHNIFGQTNLFMFLKCITKWEKKERIYSKCTYTQMHNARCNNNNSNCNKWSFLSTIVDTKGSKQEVFRKGINCFRSKIGW